MTTCGRLQTWPACGRVCCILWYVVISAYYQFVSFSKGSGRTGTYIALDAIFNNIGLSKTVDVFNYVNYLRTRRTNMVATERQYEFIYEVINDLLNKVDRNTELTKRNAKELFSSLSTVDPLTGHNGFQKLFKNISQGLETASSLVKKLEGSQAINEYKNRYIQRIQYKFAHLFVAYIFVLPYMQLLRRPTLRTLVGILRGAM